MHGGLASKPTLAADRRTICLIFHLSYIGLKPIKDGTQKQRDAEIFSQKK